MKEAKVMKSMSKAVFALCIALSVLVGNSAIASAAVMSLGNCDHYADGHHFIYERTGTDVSDIYETHMHYIGKNVSTGEDVYVSCTLLYHSEAWVAKCSCGQIQPGSRQIRQDPVKHSVN